MQPTTIYLPTETQNKLEKICQEKGKTVAEVIQEIVINQKANINCFIKFTHKILTYNCDRF